MKLAICSMIVCSLLIHPSHTETGSTVDIFSLLKIPVVTALLEGSSPLDVLINLAKNALEALSALGPVLTGSVDRYYCKEEICKKPSLLIPVTEYLVTRLASPLYVSCLPQNNKTKYMDNICYTFISTNNETEVLFCISIVYENGTNERFCYLDNDGPGLGKLSGANPTCAFKVFVVGVQCADCFILYRCFLSGDPTCTFKVFAIGVQCGDCFVLYRCFLMGGCQEFDTIKDPGFDQVFGVCASPYQSDSCKNGTIDFIKSQPQFNTRPFHKLPQKLPYQCITCLPNNGTAINTKKLREQNNSCEAQPSATNNSSSLLSLEDIFEGLKTH